MRMSPDVLPVSLVDASDLGVGVVECVGHGRGSRMDFSRASFRSELTSPAYTLPQLAGKLGGKIPFSPFLMNAVMFAGGAAIDEMVGSLARDFRSGIPE